MPQRVVRFSIATNKLITLLKNPMFQVMLRIMVQKMEEIMTQSLSLLDPLLKSPKRLPPQRPRNVQRPSPRCRAAS